jgi:hypothetical protein
VKTLILPVAILVNLISYTALADGPVGRFQLAPASVETLSPGTSTAEKEQKMLFKVDTVTGRTWYYVTEINKEGELVNKWVEIEK